ncbi:MAG: poly-gamma-glutamate hydrolase family protein [Acidimicrobiia bacterium]|nr:poly-gamma-glutamate hydrolase family protein [Acidimicrobiia bacterium]
MLLAEVLARPDVCEELELGSSVGLMAIHGGGLERTTDVVARAVAERVGGSYYAVLFPDDADLDDHPPSTAFDPDQSTALATFLERVDTVVSVHGYGRRHLRYSLLLGGRNRPLADHIAATVSPRLIDYDFVTDLARIPRPLRGMHPLNPVNRPPNGGVQIELPPSIRWHWTGRGWSDSPGVGRAPQLTRLVDGLVDALSSWVSSPSA